MLGDNLNNSQKEAANEDVVYEAEDSSYTSDTSSLLTKIKKLKTELGTCKKEKQEYLDGWQRSKADFINFKKRSEEDKKALTKYANEDFIIKLLPALDSFEHAFKNKEAWEKAPPDWRVGIEFIHSQLKGVLSEHGITEINPENEIFDAERHHSIEMVEVEDEEKDGKIIEVILKGYKLEGKIIRYPTVKVGKRK